MDTQEVPAENISDIQENAEPKIEEIISETDQQINSLKDQLLRALAENENTRRRSAKDKEDALKYGVTNLARDIIGVADNLQRVLSNKSENAADLSEALFSGVDLILKDLSNIFTRHGIQRIEAGGQQFDPHSHQAVFEEETDEHKPGTVVQVIQDGYKIHERLLRPAMVAVAKTKKDSAAS
ncbi:MAG: nucleotide exchange factor GrpE [Proteobacteria bacterium]|nr:nucleotide exchange factor GrpE [Pseudomonadota bacterium]